MRVLLFFIYKIFRRLESLLWGKGLREIPGVTILYRVWLSFCGLIYDTAKPKGITLIEVQGNKMYVNTDDMSTVPMLLDGMIEEYDTELFKEAVKEGMVVVDVGANIGYYTLIAAKLVGNKGMVYAFEPEPSNYELLCKNIEVNGYTNVVPVQKAISNKQGKAKLWVNKVVSFASSFSKDNVLAFSKDKVIEEDSFIEVETITLDDFFANMIKNSRVDFIKIDVEGAEELVIDGAEKILQSNNLKILMEFLPDALRNLGTDPLKLLNKLQEYGFKIEFINERKQTLEPLEKIINSCAKPMINGGFNLLLERK